MKRSTYSSFVDVRKALYELRFNNSPFYKMAAVNTNVVHTYQMHHSELSCLCQNVCFTEKKINFLNFVIVTIVFVKMVADKTNNNNKQKIYNSVAAGYPVRRRCKTNNYTKTRS